MRSTIPLRFELPHGQLFIGELWRQDTGSETPAVFYIKEFINGKRYHAGHLVRYTTREGVTYWQADGVLAPFSEELGLMVEAVDWGAG